MGSSSFSGGHHGGSNQQKKEGWKIGKVCIIEGLSRMIVTLKEKKNYLGLYSGYFWEMMFKFQ